MATFILQKGKTPVASYVENDLSESINKVLVDTGNRQARLHERVTAQWSSAPNFYPMIIKPGDGRFRLEVWLVGSDHDRMKWHSMNKGQESRVITSQGKGMIYRPGYKASTQYRKLASRQRERYGNKRVAGQVTHRQEARDISDEVNEQVSAKADRLIRSALWTSFKRTL